MKNRLFLVILFVFTTLQITSSYGVGPWVKRAHQKAFKKFPKNVRSKKNPSKREESVHTREFTEKELNLFGKFIKDKNLTREQAYGICRSRGINPAPLKELKIKRQMSLRRCYPSSELIPTNSQMLTDGDRPWSCGYRAVFNACRLARDSNALLADDDPKESDVLPIEDAYEEWFSVADPFIQRKHKGAFALGATDEDFDTGDYLPIEYVSLLLQEEIRKENDPIIKQRLQDICLISKANIESVERGNYFPLNGKIQAFRDNPDGEKELIVIMLYGSHYKTFIINDYKTYHNALFQADSLLTKRCGSIPYLWRYIHHLPLLTLEDVNYRNLILPEHTIEID